MKYKNVRRKASAALFVGALAFSNMATPLFAKENMNTKTSTLAVKGSFGDRSFGYANTVLKETQTVNKTQLANKIVEVEKIDKTKYTSESYQTLADAIEKAKVVENNQSATADEIANVMRELDQAVSALVLLNTNKPVLDKNNLADGTYEVGVNLWNADHDKPSMADTSFFKTAKIVVKKGVYTIYIRTKPMTLGTITASLQELKVKDNGTFKLAKVETTENGSPTSFSFILPTRDMYLDVLVNPNVAIMGHRDVAARIKISYDTLKKLSEDVDAPSQKDTTTGSSVTEGKDARKDAPVIKQTGAQTSNNVGFISLIALSLAGVLAYMSRRKFLLK